MALHKITEFCTKWFSVCPNITSKFEPPPYLKAPPKKIMVQIKLVGISMIFHCTRLPLSKSNGFVSCLHEMNANFKFQPPVIFVFLFFTKVFLLKVVYPLKIFQITFHDPTLTGANFASASVV